jgi:hypothetical protein
MSGDHEWARTHFNSIIEEDPAWIAIKIDSARQMLDAFRVAESYAFERARVPKEVRRFIATITEEVMWEIEQLGTTSQESWNGLRQKIDALRNEACRNSYQLNSADKFRNVLRRTAFVFAGGGVIKINFSVDALTTWGLSPWMTALSGKLGEKLILKGVES